MADDAPANVAIHTDRGSPIGNHPDPIEPNRRALGFVMRNAFEIINQFLASSSAVTSLDALNSVQTVFAADTNARGFLLYNDSNKDAYVKLGTAASLTSFSFKIPPDSPYDRPFLNYTGIVTVFYPANSSGKLHATRLLL